MICCCLMHGVFLQKERKDNPEYSYAVYSLDVHEIVSFIFLHRNRLNYFTPVSAVMSGEIV